MNEKVIEILTDRIEALEWILKIKEEEIEIIQKGKELFHLAEIYYYESIIKNEAGDYEGAF